MKTIKTVGVVGAGTMGSALAQKFAQEGFQVILADREMQFVERGLNGIKTTLNEGVEKKVFTPEQTSAILSRITGTARLDDLKSCNLIIEAIFEDFNAKKDLFNNLSDIVPSDTVLATNTSSFSVNDLSASVKNPSRFIGVHYFYHAAKNRLVEIIPGEKTAPEVFEAMKVFSMQSGKDAITCRDAYGFVVNRYFVPWLNEASRLLEENVANIPTIDDVCMKIFGIGMGPFALMNATGVPVAYHSQKTLEIFGSLYKVSERLKQQTESKQNWKLAEEISTDETLRKKISERMQGVVFLVCSQLLDEKVCAATDINRGARIGLRWRKGPVEMMQQLGEAEVQRMVKQIADLYQTPFPKSIGNDFWKMHYVTLQKKNSIAIVTMSRPEDLNALSEEVMAQLDEKFSEADSDSSIKTIFITGTGKAFVAGADIKFFVKNMKNKTLDRIVTFTAYGQRVYEKIDRSQKKVVAVINGMALGGGLELALCADVILALPKALMAFPETGIGIYPGLGGTQRSSARVGKGIAKYLILTGRMLSARDAVEIGLADAQILQEEMVEMLNGNISVPAVAKNELTGKWNAIADLYSKNSYKAIVSGSYSNGPLEKDEVAKHAKTLGYKAPIAMQIAEELIEQAKGPASELEKLTTIFSTSDAMKGLTSIGKKVEYEGK